MPFLLQHTRMILLAKNQFLVYLGNFCSGINIEISYLTAFSQVDGTDEDTAEDYTINYDFNLAAPTITFHPTRTTPVCDLTVPIIGGTAKKSTQTNSVTIKSGIYTLQINTLELKTMKGGDDPDDSTSADKPFEFKDDTTKDGVVVIDLPTSKNLTIQIDKVSETDKVLLIDNHKDKIVDALKTKLHSSADYNSIRLELARINASKPPVGSVQLVPKCFMFAAYYPSKDDLETVLSLFIQTEDSNNGQQEDLSDYWISHWKVNLQCSPIPSGQTTSIIFNKDLIYRKMIEPSLKAQNFSSKLVDLLGNLKLSVSTGLKVHRDKYYQKNSLGDGSTEERTVTEINQTPPDLTLTLDEVRRFWVFSTDSIPVTDNSPELEWFCRMLWILELPVPLRLGILL